MMIWLVKPLLTEKSGSDFSMASSIAPMVKRRLSLKLVPKLTTKSSFSVTRKILEKIENDALGQNALPLLHIEINSDTISAKEFFVMPKWALIALLAELEND